MLADPQYPPKRTPGRPFNPPKVSGEVAVEPEHLPHLCRDLATSCVAQAARLLEVEVQPLAAEDDPRIDRSERALAAAERLVRLAERLDLLGDKVDLRDKIEAGRPR